MDDQIITQCTSSVSNRESIRNNVTQEWLKSGVTQEYIDFLFEHYQFDGTGLFICDAQEARQLLQMDYPLDHQEYYWGFKDINGNIQIKVNIPNGAKYLCPRNNGSDAFRLPIPDYFEGESLKTTIEDFETVAIIEGIKKAASLISNGENKIYPIAVIGVHCALPNPKKSKAKQRHFLKEFLSTAVELDKDCLIIFDKDWQTNEQVGKALIKTHIAYLTMGLDTYTPTWKTDHKGIDDYLGSLKPNMRHKAIIGFVDNPGDSLTFEQVREQLEKIYSQEPGKKGKPKTAENIRKSVVDKYRNNWKYSVTHDSWFYWNGKYWERKPHIIIASDVQRLLDERHISYGSSSKIDDVVKQMSRELIVENWLTINQKRDQHGESLPPRYINLLNGVYDIKEQKLIPHFKDSMFLSVVNREYHLLETTGNILADLEKYAPTWYRSYLSVVNGNKTKLLKLLAVINGVLTHRLSYHHKFITLIGSPGSGKSSFARLLNRMVGDDNTKFTSLKKLNSEYTIASLINSQLVVCDDEEKQTDFEYLRKLTGSGKVEYRQIYGKPGNAEFLGSILVNAVHNPFAGDIAGLERRLFLLKFDGKFKHRDTAVEDYIWEHELEPLMAIALSMPEVEVDGYLLEKLQYSDSNSLNDKWIAVCDSEAIASWMDLNLIQSSPDEFIPIGEFFESFCNYCDDNKFNKLNSNTFSKRLSEYLDILGWKHSKKQMRYRGKKVRGISGIKLRSVDELGYVPFEEIDPTITEILTTPQSGSVQSVQSVHSPPIPVSESVSDVPIPDMTISTSSVQPSTSSVHHPDPVSDPVECVRNLDQTTVPMNSESGPMTSSGAVQPEPAQSKDCTDSTDSTDKNPTLKEMQQELWQGENWETWTMETDLGGFGDFPFRASQAKQQARCGRLLYDLMKCSTNEQYEALKAVKPEYKKQLMWALKVAKHYNFAEWEHYCQITNSLFL